MQTDRVRLSWLPEARSGWLGAPALWPRGSDARESVWRNGPLDHQTEGTVLFHGWGLCTVGSSVGLAESATSLSVVRGGGYEN